MQTHDSHIKHDHHANLSHHKNHQQLGMFDNTENQINGIYIWEADLSSKQIVQTDVDTKLDTRISCVDFFGRVHANDASKLKRALEFSSGQKRRPIDVDIRLSSGGAYQQYKVKGVAFCRGEDSFAAGIIYNAEIASAQAARLHYLEKHDALTGLVNSQTLDALFGEISEYGMYPQTLVVADIDRFKEINDTLGYHAGNTLIRNVADVIKECFVDAELIARIGGGQYCAIYAGQDQLEIDNKIKEARMQLHGMYLNLIKAEVSFGYAVTDQDSGFCSLYSEAMSKIRRSRNTRKVLKSCSVVDDLNRVIEAKLGWGKRQTRLQSLATQIATGLECSEECIETIKVLAKIADIGLISVSDHLLKNRATLTDEQCDEYNGYIELGRSLISSIDEVSEFESLYLDIFKRYDEWQDAIALPSRIVAGAKGFDDIVSASTSVKFKDIKAKFLEKRGGEYCPEVADAILAVAKKHYA